MIRRRFTPAPASPWRRRLPALALVMLAGAPGGWGFVAVMSRALGAEVRDPVIGAIGGLALAFASACLAAAVWVYTDAGGER